MQQHLRQSGLRGDLKLISALNSADVLSGTASEARGIALKDTTRRNKKTGPQRTAHAIPQTLSVPGAIWHEPL